MNIPPIHIKTDLTNQDEKTTIQEATKEELQLLIATMERELASGEFFTSHENYASIDLGKMPLLIEAANNKHVGLNLNFVSNPIDLPSEIGRAISNGKEQFRYVVNMGESGIHFAAIDCKMVDGKLSLLLMEPANLNSMGPAMLAMRVSSCLKREAEIIPKPHFCIAVMDIQRSNSECGIFSVGLAKKMFSERAPLDALHEEILSERLPDGMKCDVLEGEALDRLLPPTFYKHAQSQRRLDQYIRAHPDGNDTSVNKKGELLLDRAKRLMVPVDEKLISSSIHQKRIMEYSAISDDGKSV
ncbi:effector protein YopJ [Aeromonas salmonicida subsp. salmonicida]|uniref:AopP n=4 Tax=Aeromonas TaxID=642 RepID=Q8GMP6_AERSS|nr:MULTISPECIES: type III secretion system YopJ family effector AopP [Aeromonas]AGN75062.1 AopP [Aeromonas salmonicida subsp. salmonicida]ALL42117.1 effector protein AopP [Aeromonas salmonicida subsp. salmonicida]ALL42125.1 effector protein AopP [Aeromonas salmonicida subsp. salmonicida]EHI50148.1 effector protein YopJ [Aeromonas salmonicida subsp. salmonicida 01-B526]EKP0267178.1 type III secretion system YopJ family effector AopP [Aeromonas salmonicida]